MASRLNPYITFDGNARQAMEFYKGVFGGELTMNYQTLGTAVPHQLPQTAPRLAELIEGVFGPTARNTLAVSAGRPVEGNRSETGASNPV